MGLNLYEYSTCNSYKEILLLTFDQARCLFLDGKVHCQRLRGEFVDGALVGAVLRDGYWSDVN